MAGTATVQENFTAFIRAKKAQPPTPIQFKVGEQVTLLKVWEGDLCLIKNKDGKAFNIRKALLNKEAFEAKGPKEEAKGRRKRSAAVAEVLELSALRPELDMARGMAPPLAEVARLSLAQSVSAFFHSRTGLGLTGVVVLLGIYLGWINLGKMTNETPSGRLAAFVISKGALKKPGHFEPPYYALKVSLDGQEGEVFVWDAPFKKTTLTLKVPGRLAEPLATDQETRWENNSLLSSRVFDEYVDVGADGTVDQFVKVKEFWTDSKKLVGAFRKSLPPEPAHAEGYREAVQKALRGLGFTP